MRKSILLIFPLYSLSLLTPVIRAQNIQDSIQVTQNIQDTINIQNNKPAIKGILSDPNLINSDSLKVTLNNVPINLNINSDGSFEILNLNPGIYILNINTNEFYPYSEKIALNSENDYYTVITLKTKLKFGTIKGYVEYDNDGQIEVIIDNIAYTYNIDKNSQFEITNIPIGQHQINIINHKDKKEIFSQSLNIENNEVTEIHLHPHDLISNIVIFGNKAPKGMDMITGIPLPPREIPQEISVISEEIIEEQGAQTITDAAQNVPGVTLFGSYGGVKESMSIRGYRGVPILKNGVQIDSDFRTASLLTDMSGVESIQVLKGSAAITQGIGNGLGSPGGVINVVTKIPRFINSGEVSIRTGSWGLFKPSFDYQTVLDKNNTAAFRINGTFQRSDSYKRYVNNNRIYVNPSFVWQPDNKTNIILEMDYMNDNTTPVRGTVNLGDINENKLYEVPLKKFFGWKTDNVNTKTAYYSARIERDLNDFLNLKVLYAASENKIENIGLESINSTPFTDAQGNIDYTQRTRSLGRSDSEDKNKIIQIDLIGKNIETGIFKHTFQTGFDYKRSDKTSISYNSIKVDAINVLNDINNSLPSNISNSSLKEKGETKTNSEVYGFMAQEALEIGNYVRANFALRYSLNSKKVNPNSKNYSWDPFFGLMIIPISNISIFGNYATTTDLRSANSPMIDGGTAGASTSNQIEIGLKSDWLNEFLSINITYFHIKNNDLIYQVYENGVSTGLYEKAGNIVRKGIDFEVTGKILDNLKVIGGYSYLNAKYKNSMSYVDGSRPMNSPKNTANGWIRYEFNKGIFKNLSLSAGIYYVGNRPVNEWSLVSDGHGTTPGIKPFNMPSYTTVNGQIGYLYKNWQLQVFLNNIFNKIGYTSYYRGGYINQIDPMNFKVQLNYNF